MQITSCTFPRFPVYITNAHTRLHLQPESPCVQLASLLLVPALLLLIEVVEALEGAEVCTVALRMGALVLAAAAVAWACASASAAVAASAAVPLLLILDASPAAAACKQRHSAAARVPASIKEAVACQP